MPSPRIAAAAATTALLLGALAFAATAQSSQAAVASPQLSAAQIAALTPTQPMKGRAWIQGVVKDQFGTPLGNVTVEATSARDEGSAITYEEPGIAGSTGFYRIYDLTPGTYTLTFTSNAPKVRSTTKTVTVGVREIGQAPVTVTRVLPVTTTSAKLTHRAVTTKQKGSVVVTVATKATKKPVGKVQVREGRTVVGSGDLKSGNRGVLTVGLQKLGKGSHVLKAYYLGSKTLQASTTKTPFTLVVTKPRH